MDRLCCLKASCSQFAGQSSSSSGKGKNRQSSVKVTYGFSLVKGKATHPMEDYHVAKFVHMKGKELGLFAIFDGHLGDSVPAYLQKNLFSNILKEEEFWTYPDRALSKAYEKTDTAILSHSPDLGRGGSTAVTAILINGRKLWIANVGDSRAVLAKTGQVRQMTVDHEPSTERGSIENRGGFVSNMPGYFLNPRYQYSDNVHNDPEVRACTLDVIRRLARTVDDRIEAEREMEPYRLRLGTYGEREMQDAIMRLSPGDVPRVNGQLAVSRAFGDKSLKSHLRSDPDISFEEIGSDTELLILASDGLWKFVTNEEAVDIARKFKDPQAAAKQLTAEALDRESKDDISCIVLRFKA